MDTESKKRKRKGGLSIPGEAKRSRRLLDVSDKLLCVRGNAIDEYLTNGAVPDKNTLKQLSALLKEVKEIQGVLSPLEKEKQLAEIVLLHKKAEEEKSDEEGLAVFIAEEAATFAQ